MATSAFAKFEAVAWPHRFRGKIIVDTLAGGTPSDANVAEGWLKTKLGSKDDLLREQVAETMAQRGITAEEAAEEVNKLKHLNGFKRDLSTGLYIEGRQLKAALKEAANVAVASGKLEARRWGTTNKGLVSFLAEHVHVVEDRLYLTKNGQPVQEADGVTQRFVHTFRGTGIQYEEYVQDAEINFVVQTDWPFTEEQWGMIWLTGEQQGIGASRSQGFGRYKITGWDDISQK